VLCCLHARRLRHIGARKKDIMGILGRLFGRKKDISETDRYRAVSKEAPVSEAQTQMNRDVMEAQMAESRAKRDAADAADAAENKDA
jgi:hypothetical protein